MFLTRTFKSVNDKPVIAGLALSPSAAYDAMRQGRPISSIDQPIEHFEEGTYNCKFSDVEPSAIRGVDVAAIWEHLQDRKRKIFDSIVEE